VVAEHGDDRQRDLRQRAREKARLLGRAVLGQVAREQQEVGVVGERRERVAPARVPST
jgi:hypothetical protein